MIRLKYKHSFPTTSEVEISYISGIKEIKDESRDKSHNESI